MKLGTINKWLNLLLICLVVETDDETGFHKLYFTTIFMYGYIYRWPHIALLDWLGY